MANVTPPPSRPAVTDPPNMRDTIAGRIAQWVVFGSVIWLICTTSIGLYSAYAATNADFVKNWKDITGILLPVIGTWIGTVLAFYFTKENFEAANRSVQSMVSKISPRDQLKSVSAKEAMIPAKSITGITLGPSKAEKDVLLDDMVHLLGDNVTRVPVFEENGAARYVVHESTLHKYLYDVQAKAVSSGTPSPKSTLEDLAKDPSADTPIRALAFVPETATLADAQDAMKQVKQCQDVFVTKTGHADEPIIGWITNADLAKQVGV
jgi:hypothetical protein